MEEFSRASSLALFDEFCAISGLDPQAMLKKAGLPADTLAHPETLVSYQRMALLLENCAVDSGKPLFGLEFGLHQGTAVFGQLLYLIKNAKTVGESLQELAGYYHLHSSSGSVKIEVHKKLAILEYSPMLRQGIPARQAIELAIAVGKKLLKTLLGNQWQPHAVHFQTAAGASPQAYIRLLGATPHFNSSRNAWIFDAALLNAPLSNADPALHELMRSHIDQLDELTPKELPAYVCHLLRNFLPNGKVTIDFIADYMMVSTRSLQRMLMDEGTSYQALLNETRQAVATRYLKESNMSLTQLAGLLGYADLASFSKAFQRWFAMSPRQWREKHGKQAASQRLARQQRAPGWLRR